MRVPLIIHISQLFKAVRLIIEHHRLFEVDLGVGDCASCHINLASHFDRLLIPKRSKIFILDLVLLLGLVEQIKLYDVVLVQ